MWSVLLEVFVLCNVYRVGALFITPFFLRASLVMPYLVYQGAGTKPGRNPMSMNRGDGDT